MKPPIQLQGVRQNNLKNITVEFPSRALTVVTGLSGSGKSSLVFETLYAEGQRRYVESLSTYTRQFLEKMPKPEVEHVAHIPPAIALEQRNSVIGSRGTVGTHTEVYDYLRVLFARIGHVKCLGCGSEVKKIDAEEILTFALEWLPSRKALLLAPLRIEVDKSSKKTSTKKKTTSKKKAPPQRDLQEIFRALASQGYTRVLVQKTSSQKSATPYELAEIEDLLESDTAKLSKLTLYVVVDRMKLESSPSPESKTRVADSIDQCLGVGHGEIGFYDVDTHELKRMKTQFACVRCGMEARIPSPTLFSFNSPMGACPQCSGFGFTLDLDENLVVPDRSKTLKAGAVDPFTKPSSIEWHKDLLRFAERHGISITKRYADLTPSQVKLLWDGVPGDKTFAGIRGCFEELKRWKYKLHVRVFIRRYQSQNLCSTCKGSRLRAEALAVSIAGKSLADITALPIEESLIWVRGIKLSPREREIAKEALSQVERRLGFLEQVGVGYLSLGRPTKTLSGGEFQRINLATQLGHGLCGTLYVLDEPSIGLHASDTQRLIGVLHHLRDQGNPVVVVEHDLEVIENADWLIELGPAAGRNGGDQVAQGTPLDLQKNPNSLTGQYLAHTRSAFLKTAHREGAKKFLKLTGCQEHNLKKITLEIPLERFTVVSGPSGSGKSTLIHKTLFPALEQVYSGGVYQECGRFDRLYGAEHLAGVVLLDQSPIGKSSRSNPATYLKIWDHVRKLYANQTLAMRRGYTAQHFSFNVDGGRCPVCKGEGEITIEMHFMAEVQLPCEECEGKRFKKSVLDITYRNKNVHQLLETTVDEAYEVFRDHPEILRKLRVLREVGLGYVQLGQSSSHLSGGESQRLKIASILDQPEGGPRLYLFDEPTTGLHAEDVRKLMPVIHDLVEAKNTVVMIEHHLDVVAQADWMIDLGPGGGKHGGEIVAMGTPEQLARVGESPTGRILAQKNYFNPA